MRDFLICKYKPEDFEAVTLLWRRAREVTFPEFQRTKGHTFAEDQDYFLGHILLENDVWVVELDEQPVAFMAIKDDFIDQLYVHPDYQRRGLGESLLAHARTLSPLHLWLYTFQINAKGRSFYEKNGFVAVKFGVSPAPESEPDVEYHWTAMEQAQNNSGKIA